MEVDPLREDSSRQRFKLYRSEHGPGFHMRRCRCQEVHVAFINRGRGLACCAALPKLSVLSTDKTYRPREDAEGAVTLDSASCRDLPMSKRWVRWVGKDGSTIIPILGQVR